MNRVMPPRKPPTSTPTPTPHDGSSIADLRSRVHSELAEIDSALALLDHDLGRAAHLAELGVLAPMFAHEVNNLMTQVGGRAQRALMYPDQAADVERALRLAVDASRQIAELGAIFLGSLSSVSASGQRQGHCVREIHQRALAFVSQRDLDAFQPTLVESEPGIEVAVLPMLLQQVLLNLYLNASRALGGHDRSGRDEAPRIITRVELIDHEPGCSTGNSGWVRIIVEDNGPGMSPSQIEHAMSGSMSPQESIVPRSHPTPPPPPPSNPGACASAPGLDRSKERGTDQREDRYGEEPGDPRATARRSQRGQGHGLGLAVCRRLLAHAGGSLRCESTPGVGTRMVVMLPAGARSGSTRRAA